jgi:hypothetical protein
MRLTVFIHDIEKVARRKAGFNLGAVFGRNGNSETANGYD